MAERTNELVNRQIGGLIRRRRKELGMSQTTLGDHVGVSYQQIGKYESGSNRVSAPVLDAIARALAVDAGAFYAGLPLEIETRVGLGEAGQERYRGVSIDAEAAARLRQALDRISDPRGNRPVSALSAF